jgi:hypothetical protein
LVQVRRMVAREGAASFFRAWPVDMAFRSGAGVLLVLYDKLQQWQARRDARRRHPRLLSAAGVLGGRGGGRTAAAAAAAVLD